MPTLFLCLDGFTFYDKEHKPDEKFAYKIINTQTGKSSAKKTFSYGETHDLRDPFHIRVNSINNQSFRILLYKKGLLKDHLLAKVKIHLSDLEINRVSIDTVPMNAEKVQKLQYAANLILHLSDDDSRPYNAPIGHSNLKQVNVESSQISTNVNNQSDVVSHNLLSIGF